MTEQEFAEIQERCANLPAVGVPSQVRIDLAACISEIAAVRTPPTTEPVESTDDAPKRTSGARKK
jgi:hypothetical protein